MRVNQNNTKQEKNREKKGKGNDANRMFWGREKMGEKWLRKIFFVEAENTNFSFYPEKTFLIPIIGECRWMDRLVCCHQVGKLGRMIMIPNG